MFRGMSGSEYSNKFHNEVEIYGRMDLPCANPLLGFSSDEIWALINERYKFKVNPLYEHMERNYCICCYTTADRKKCAYSEKRFPEIYKRYYKQIEEMLFDSGLIEKCGITGEYATKKEKLEKHGFVHWRRSKNQEKVGAIKYQIGNNSFAYNIRDAAWIDEQHLAPVAGKWHRKGNEIRFTDLPETICDTIIKRMINCLNCGYCSVQCFKHRTFDYSAKKLCIENCQQCGKCLNVKFCMGWKHRFWRRIIMTK